MAPYKAPMTATPDAWQAIKQDVIQALAYESRQPTRNTDQSRIALSATR